jgi:hypothetical protein
VLAPLFHTDDKLIDIPGRFLFDTNVVNLVLDFGEFIVDGGEFPDDQPPALTADLIALKGIFSTGQRAAWQIAISPITYAEIARTAGDLRRRSLNNWFNELWLYWREIFNEEGLSDDAATSSERQILQSGSLATLPDDADCALIAHAIAYECDAFCTRDQKTILRHRHKLVGLPLKIVSPAELWLEIKPYAAMWM